MKQLLPLLFLIAIYAGCTKTVYDQPVTICDFPVVQGQSWLVVTNDAGDILQTTELPAGTSQFIEKFDFDAKNVLDKYNLHYVNTNYTSSIASFYGVPKGAAVCFASALRYAAPFPAFTQAQILVTGVNIPPEIIDIPGKNHAEGYQISYNAVKHTISMPAAIIGDDILVRIRPQGAAEYRSLFVPTKTLAGDTLRLKWADFLPETNFKSLELPADSLQFLEVDAIEPDFKRSVNIAQYYSLDQQPVLVSNQILLYTGLSPQSNFRVWLRQGDYLAEKIFQPGETLRLEKSKIDIKSAHFSFEGTIDIQTEGSLDLVETSIYLPSLTIIDYYSEWNIQGPPEACKHIVLPDLASLLPGWTNPNAHGSFYYSVTAYQYDSLDFTQLLEGFPYKGYDGRLFPLARAGMQKVSKGY